MKTTLSIGFQVTLPAELCERATLVPGAELEIGLSPDGSGILIQPVCGLGKKSANVIFDRFSHPGNLVSVEQMQGVAVAKAAAVNSLQPPVISPI